jgi:hypothetical protein
VSNLDLWDKVSKTDPNYTKKAKKGAYNFTSIAPIYQFKKATEAFGVQGIGWGVVVGSEIFSEREYGTTVILSYDATMFFTVNGERGEIPIHASEKACYQTQGANGYMKVDDEARKKVVTNAKTKGLSELGFNADIFMGEYDNPDYVKAVGNEFALENAGDQIEERAAQQKEYEDWSDSVKELMKTASSMNELKQVFKGAAGKAKLYDDSALIVQLNNIKDRRKIQLEANKEKS